MLSLILAGMGRAALVECCSGSDCLPNTVESGLSWQKAKRQLKADMSIQRLLTAFGIVLLFLGLLPSAHSQTKNEVGLVIGATTTPSQTLPQGGDLSFTASLALGAEYDRRLATAKRVGIYAGRRLSGLSV